MTAAAIAATSRRVRTLADGTLVLEVSIEPNDASDAFGLFGSPGTPVALARLTQEAAQERLQRETITSEYGHAYQILYRHGWFLNPRVAPALGTDAEFLAWLCNQCCAFECEDCAGQIVAAHVRRIANGAGIGIKPPFSAIPLCDGHHHIQHQQGESALGGADKFDRLWAGYLTQWIKERLYKRFGVGTLALVSPQDFINEMTRLGIADTLPREFGANQQ